MNGSSMTTCWCCSSHKLARQNQSWAKKTMRITRRMDQLTGHPVVAKGLLQYCAPMSSHSAIIRSSAVDIQPACEPLTSNFAKKGDIRELPASIEGETVTGAKIGLPIASVPVCTC